MSLVAPSLVTSCRSLAHPPACPLGQLHRSLDLASGRWAAAAQQAASSASHRIVGGREHQSGQEHGSPCRTSVSTTTSITTTTPSTYLTTDHWTGSVDSTSDNDTRGGPKRQLRIAGAQRTALPIGRSSALHTINSAYRFEHFPPFQKLDPLRGRRERKQGETPSRS